MTGFPSFTSGFSAAPSADLGGMIFTVTTVFPATSCLVLLSTYPPRASGVWNIGAADASGATDPSLGYDGKAGVGGMGISGAVSPDTGRKLLTVEGKRSERGVGLSEVASIDAWDWAFIAAIIADGEEGLNFVCAPSGDNADCTYA